MKRLLFLFITFLPISLFAQPVQDLLKIEQIIESNGIYEKIYVHTDRDYYTGGGDVFFKVYLTDASLLQEKSSSKVAYVDLIDENKKVVQSKTIAIQDGQGVGDFQLTSKYKSGNYILRAYTEYMKNFDTAFFFRKTIYIRSITNSAVTKTIVTKKAVVQFFPEGGDLVDGLTSKIGIKATDKNGFGIKIAGQILAADQQEISTISTNKNGFGQFLLTPRQGQTYTFTGTYNGEAIKASLPKILKEGAILSLENGKNEMIKVQINTNVPTITMIGNGYLIGQAMGQVFFKEKIESAATTDFELDGYDIPYGVLHFTLFDNLGRPLAERLFFNHVGIDNFNVDISADKATYEKRDKVQLKLDVYDDNGEIIETDLSLSVRSNYLERATANNDNIQSYLLLSSDIKGVIENPTAYFIDTEKATIANLDLLLLTQGWRRFVWQDALKIPIEKLPYQPEQSLSIAGEITKKDVVDKPVKAVGFLSELSANLSMIDFETNSAGQFSIDGLQAVNGTEMILQAAILDKKQQKVKKGSYILKGNRAINIELAEKQPLPVNNDLTYFLKKANRQKEKYTSLSNLENVSYKNDLAYEDIGFSIDIDSVEITATKIDKVIDYYEDGMLYSRPDTRLLMEEVADPNSYNNILGILAGRVPGLTFGVGGMEIRGTQSGPAGLTSNTPEFMVNGSAVSKEFVLSINPANVAFIDVLKGLSTLSIYGEYGGNGLVMIYLKPPRERQQREKKEVPGIINFTFNGYDQARAFYTPVYTDLNRTISKADNRVTLHWTPTIQFNNEGEAYIEFFTSDRVGTYDIIVEGLSKEGLPIFAKSKIIVE